MPLPGALLGGLLGGLGSIFGSSIEATSAQRAAAANRDFQERMYKHRYQYQMEDMREAGLNPLLAFQQAPPASPQGATAQVPRGTGQAAVASATAMAQGMANVRATNAKAALDEAALPKAGLIGDVFDDLREDVTGARDWLKDKEHSAKNLGYLEGIKSRLLRMNYGIGDPLGIEPHGYEPKWRGKTISTKRRFQSKGR